MACSTGEACGLTDTRSGASRCANHSAVMRLTIEALDAWWPPTFTPEGFGRTRLAWCTIDVASHSTRRWTASSAARSRSWCVDAVTATSSAYDLRGRAAADVLPEWVLEVQHARRPRVREQLGVRKLGAAGGAEAEHALGAEHARGDRASPQQLRVVVARHLASVGRERMLELGEPAVAERDVD